MIALRVVGGVFGVILLIGSYLQYRRRNVSRLSLIITGLVATVIVILPAYNEAGNVGAVIHSMPGEVEGYPVVPLVIDDASEDETSEVARSAGALVARLPIRRGGGLALRVGYEIVLRLDAAVVVTM